MRRPLANALDIDLRGGLTSEVTPHAGSGLLIELGRRSGVIAAAERHLPAKKSTRGLRQGELVESLVLLSALGGECLDDFDPPEADGAIVGWPRCWAMTCRPPRPPANGWIASMTRRRSSGARARAASSRPSRTGWPGCERSCSTRPGPTWQPCGPLPRSPWTWTRTWWSRPSAAPCRPTRGSGATSRCWCNGPRPGWCWPTSSATATSRPRATSRSWSTRRTTPCRRETAARMTPGG